jgi:drug/metabolite transporter (DMT)-like permease
MALGAFWFSVMGALVKVVGRRLPSTEIVSVRAVVTLVLSYGLVHRARLSPWGTNHRLLLLRGFLGFSALTCSYFSLVHLPLAEATVIQYGNPVFAAILAAWLLDEHFGAREMIAVSVSLAGVLLLSRPSFLFGHSATVHPLYVGIALAGAVFSAAAYVTVRTMRGEDHPLVIVFYFALVSVPASLPLAIPVWIPPTRVEWLVMLAVGIATQAGQVNITRGLQLEPAGRATAIGYLQIAFATTWGALLFHERPDLLALIGGAIVIAGTLGIALRRVTPQREEPAVVVAAETS